MQNRNDRCWRSRGMCSLRVQPRVQGGAKKQGPPYLIANTLKIP